MKMVKWVCRLVVVAFAGSLFFYGFASVSPLYANDAKDSRQVAEKARMTLEDFINAPEMEAFRGLMKHAKGIFIAPQILKGAFVVGASGGTGAFLARDAKTRQWAGPAFYSIGEASFGLQAGGEASEVVLLAMTERGVAAMLENSLKLGGDANVAAGPVGVGISASTENLSVDILSFARSKGLFGGLALNGAVITVRPGLNRAYYGKKNITPADILIKRNVTSPHSQGLINELSRVSGK